MFAWKRQRKEEEPSGMSPPTCPRRLASAATSGCNLDSLEVASPANSSVGVVSSDAGSIEMAAASHQPLQSGSVRSKAAYFEALCRANTTLHIQCSSLALEHCSRQEELQAGLYQLESDSDMVQADSDEEASGGWQEFSEVHLLLRMPRSSASGQQEQPASSSKYGSVAEMEALIEQLQQALTLKEAQRKAAVDTLTRRSSECANLQTVVRELTKSRSKAVSQRAMLAEKYGELQQEYHRMLRIADLSRTVSKENLATTSRTRSELLRVQSELHATKSHALSLNEKHKKARVENALLKEKVTLLERLPALEDVQESVCRKQFTRYRLAETY